MEEEIKDAEIIQEKALIKPIFEGEPEAKIIAIGEVEANISKVEEYAIELNNYYNNIKFTKETIDDAKAEKAKVNKFKEKVETFRKNIVIEYSKPIKEFEETAKRTEKTLKETYDLINNQCKVYDDEKKAEIKEKLEKYFNEYCFLKNINKDYLKFDDLKINVILEYATETGSLSKKAKDEVNKKVDSVAEELETINTMQNSNEILAEYLKTRDITAAIKEVNRRHQMIEQIEKENKIEKEQKLTDEQVISKVHSLCAPKVEEVAEEILELCFKVRGTKKQLTRLINYMEVEGVSYEQC